MNFVAENFCGKQKMWTIFYSLRFRPLWLWFSIKLLFPFPWNFSLLFVVNGIDLNNLCTPHQSTQTQRMQTSCIKTQEISSIKGNVVCKIDRTLDVLRRNNQIIIIMHNKRPVAFCTIGVAFRFFSFFSFSNVSGCQRWRRSSCCRVSVTVVTSLGCTLCICNDFIPEVIRTVDVLCVVQPLVECIADR